MSPASLQSLPALPSQYLALLLGVLLAAITVGLSRTRIGALVAAFVLLAAAVPLLPFGDGAGWYYWPAASVVVFVFGLRKLDLTIPFSRRPN